MNEVIKTKCPSNVAVYVTCWPSTNCMKEVQQTPPHCAKSVDFRTKPGTRLHRTNLVAITIG